jgi:hypothetical protein
MGQKVFNLPGNYLLKFLLLYQNSSLLQKTFLHILLLNLLIENLYHVLVDVRWLKVPVENILNFNEM